MEAWRPRLKEILASLIELLHAHDVRYAVIGANALSLYIDPRMTIDIDVLVDGAQRRHVERILASRFEAVSSDHACATFRDGDVTVDVRYAGTAADEFALKNAVDGVILGTELRAASPEALLRLYLLSERPQNFADGVMIIRSRPAVDVTRLRRVVAADGPASVERLEEMVAAAAKPVISYEESRARRS